MIIIIDYGVGNLGSIANMLKKAGVAAMISSDPSVIERADKLILPGVGAFDNGMMNLAERNLIPVLNYKALTTKTPILGLCLGMELMTKHSTEGQHPGLAWFDAETVQFNFDESHADLRVPHMGWNTVVAACPEHPLFIDLDNDHRFYFAHSFHVVCTRTENILAYTDYGYLFPSMIVQDNLIGAQFHPERSHIFGLKLLKNFAEKF